jgi:hypothetical protein
VIQRRLVAGIVFGATLSVLAGCGFEAPDVEASEHASVQAADFNVGVVHVGDAFITTTPATAGAAASVNLFATLVNESNQVVSLTTVTTPLGTATMSGPGVSAAGVNGAELSLPPKGVLTDVGFRASAPEGVSSGTITIAATTPPVVGGFVPVTFAFSTGEASGVVQVPVVPPGETTATTVTVPTTQATAPTPSGVSASD